MNKDKRCRGAAHRLSKTLGETNRCLRLATLIDQRRIDELVTAIQQHYSELLLRQLRHFRTQIRDDVSGLAKRGAPGWWRQPNRFTPPGQSGQESPILA